MECYLQDAQTVRNSAKLVRDTHVENYKDAVTVKVRRVLFRGEREGRGVKGPQALGATALHFLSG